MQDEKNLKIVEKQKELDNKVLSVGEFRRATGILFFFFFWVEGAEHNNMAHGYLFHGEERREDSARLTGRIDFSINHPFLEEFTFLHALAGEGFTAGQSIPAPAQLYTELVRESNEDKVNEFYSNCEEFFWIFPMLTGKLF